MILESKKRCLICDNSQFSQITPKVRDSNQHKIIKCKKCQHVQLFPLPSLDDDANFYDQNQQIKNLQTKFSIKTLESKTKNDVLRRINLVSSYCSKNDKILEIGSGYGFFLKNMSEFGFDITGIEISKTRRKISKKLSQSDILNLNLLSDNIDYNKKFNIITLFHVLEHISNPKKFLKNIKTLMFPASKIFVEVPNLDDYQITTNPYYTKWFWQRAHLSYFSKNSLQQIFRACGFKKIKIFGIQRYGIDNMINWQIVKKPQLSVPKNILSNELDWLNIYYKQNLEKNMNSDTLFLIAQK